MKVKLKIVKSLTFAFLLFSSCNIISPPPPPERQNPLDPANPNFLPPSAEIVEGPSDGSTVTTHTVTFKWRGKQNESLMQFSYKLDNQPWSNWSESKEATFTYLDEGKHTFMLKARYVNNIEQTQPVTVNFTVDAVKGPALMFVPRKVEVSRGSSFDVEVYVEEGSNFAGAKIVIEYNSALFALENVEIYKDSRNLLLKNGGTLIDFVDSESDRITISVATAGGNPENVSGTGAIGKIRFKANASPGSYEIKFSSESKLRDSNNGDVQIKNLVSEIVVVK